MSAPTEPRPVADIVQDALAAADVAFRALFGPPAGWSDLVLVAYRQDQKWARLLATNYGEAA
ncbi:hypothetical protein [Streptomyces sp. WM6349]|uniref:hypothetical protein n=1 Tax=Streptomyces sp. WM6349 TaxID=1415552 RepID=UPI0006AF714E|nr:hypothetical protein [Streptomyces sp. WM6349]KOU17060.1 hypothetical protein ADK49_17155 [Streptomyces sp. WM6349]